MTVSLVHFPTMLLALVASFVNAQVLYIVGLDPSSSLDGPRLSSAVRRMDVSFTIGFVVKGFDTGDERVSAGLFTYRAQEEERMGRVNL